jgi:hypothetical protein
MPEAMERFRPSSLGHYLAPFLPMLTFRLRLGAPMRCIVPSADERREIELREKPLLPTAFWKYGSRFLRRKIGPFRIRLPQETATVESAGPSGRQSEQNFPEGTPG